PLRSKGGRCSPFLRRVDLATTRTAQRDIEERVIRVRLGRVAEEKWPLFVDGARHKTNGNRLELIRDAPYRSVVLIHLRQDAENGRVLTFRDEEPCAAPLPRQPCESGLTEMRPERVVVPVEQHGRADQLLACGLEVQLGTDLICAEAEAESGIGEQAVDPVRRQLVGMLEQGIQ